MIIQLNTDHNIQSTERLVSRVEASLGSSLERFKDHVTRVEVHLSDENGAQKSGVDEMRCMLEARLEHHQPVVVTNTAMTVEQAIDGAATKMRHALDSLLGKLAERHAPVS